MGLDGKYEVGHRIQREVFVVEGMLLLESVYSQGIPLGTKPTSVGSIGRPRILIDSSQPTLVRYENIPDGLKGKLENCLSAIEAYKQFS